MIEEFFEYSPYELGKESKSALITMRLKELTQFHRQNCKEYDRFLNSLKYDEKNIKSASDIPFFPVRLFKMHDLMSISQDEIFKVMTSSGTSGQSVSKIYVDKETAMTQNKVMLKILSDFWGHKRLPMLVIDREATVRNRSEFTARGAAILGLLMASKKTVYALKEDMSLDTDAVDSFVNQFGDSPFIVFGFTSIVWLNLYNSAMNAGKKWDLSNAWLMTGGGWKKMTERSVEQSEFKEKMRQQFGIKHFIDHYAMVEQTGCIYAECECGHLHSSIFSDVFVRRPDDFSLCDNGEKGILQVVSAIPQSYPGHSLLTEDEGVILGEDDCPCGRKGKYIKIFGRLKSAELRGCSDTYADRIG